MVENIELVPWIPTPQAIVEYLVNSISIDENDTILDMGCGDGRVILAFARHGANGICIEINKTLCNIVEIASHLLNVRDKIRIICKDFFAISLSDLEPVPTIVYLYLYKSILEKIAPKMERELSIGTIIITLDFPIGNWSPFFVKHVVDENEFDRFLWFYILGISNPTARRLRFIDDENINLIQNSLAKRRLHLYRNYGQNIDPSSPFQIRRQHHPNHAIHSIV